MLNNEIERMESTRDQILASMLERLRNGAEVEPGVHQACLVERISKGPKQLWVEVR